MLDVLKRILASALGALGLGALAAVPTAFAQDATPGSGNIPAPHIFNDQITCSMNVPGAMDTPMPTQVPENGMTSPLDDIIGMGDRELNTTVLTEAADQQTLMNLGYVIPAMGANCGRGALDTTDADSIARTASFEGYDANGNGDFTDAGDIPPKNSIPTDVAKGYSDLLERFVAVYGDPGVQASTGTAGALADAQKALTDAIERGLTGTALTPFQNAVTTAQEADDKARAAFNAIAQGPINQAGVAEWMAKAAVTQSVTDYNMAVVAANMAKMTLDDMDYGSYVPLGNPELITTVVTGLDTDDPMVVLAQLTQYTNGDLTTPQVGTQGMVGTGDGQGDNAPMGSVTTDSNFDASGNLIVPMEPNTDTADNLLDLRSVLDSTNNGVDQIRTRVEQVNKAAEAIKKLRDENVNPLVQSTYDEAYRRAKAEADYYNAEWAEVLADNTDIRTDAQKLNFVDDNGNGVRDTGEADNPNYEANPITIARRQSEYVSESNKRFTAEQNLRAAVAAREMATANVRMQFTSPHSFYNQLIARREALKAAADQAVLDASEDGATPPMNLVDDATAAADALTKAREAQESFANLFEDADNPTVDLINTLLETGGDDGQALVDAISATYDETVENGTAIAENGTAIAENGTAIAENGTAIAENGIAIAENATAIDGLTGDDGAVGMNTARITANEVMLMDHEAESPPTRTIITALDGRVSTNETMIGENRTMIGENRTMIGANTTMIGENRTMIGTNTTNITANATQHRREPNGYRLQHRTHHPERVRYRDQRGPYHGEPRHDWREP